MTIRHGYGPHWAIFPPNVSMSDALPADNSPECAPAGENFGTTTTRSPLSATDCGFDSHRRRHRETLKHSPPSAHTLDDELIVRRLIAMSD
jgi:hypothetical protein